MKDLNENELRKVDGGSTNPTYYLKDNYDGITYSGAFFWVLSVVFLVFVK